MYKLCAFFNVLAIFCGVFYLTPGKRKLKNNLQTALYYYREVTGLGLSFDMYTQNYFEKTNHIEIQLIKRGVNGAKRLNQLLPYRLRGFEEKPFGIDRYDFNKDAISENQAQVLASSLLKRENQTEEVSILVLETSNETFEQKILWKKNYLKN